MGSPISTWESVAACFTGAGSASTGIVLLLSVAAMVGAIVIGHHHESHAYDNVKS